MALISVCVGTSNNRARTTLRKSDFFPLFAAFSPQEKNCLKFSLLN